MNVATLIGRMTKDILVKRTLSGNLVANFILAVNRRAKDGEQQADFINCIAWNKTVEILEKYTHKGSQIGIKGRIQTRNYENQQGQKVYVTEILVEEVQLLDSKGGSSNNGESEEVNYLEINNEDLPF